MKCQHPKTTTLYAQRRDGSKRAFKPEGRKCEACGAVLPFRLEGGVNAVNMSGSEGGVRP